MTEMTDAADDLRRFQYELAVLPVQEFPFTAPEHRKAKYSHFQTSNDSYTINSTKPYYTYIIIINKFPLVQTTQNGKG